MWKIRRLGDRVAIVIPMSEILDPRGKTKEMHAKALQPTGTSAMTYIEIILKGACYLGVQGIDVPTENYANVLIDPPFTYEGESKSSRNDADQEHRA